MEHKHTPLPWKAVRVFVNNEPDQYHVTTGEWGAESVAVCPRWEDAEFIARACNSYPVMLKALRVASSYYHGEGRESGVLEGIDQAIHAAIWVE